MPITGKIQFLQLENLSSIAFTDSGDKTKPCLLFLHGLANYHAVWQPAIDILQQSFRCIAIDLPGHGNSALNTQTYGIDYYSKCIQECTNFQSLVIQWVGILRCIWHCKK